MCIKSPVINRIYRFFARLSLKKSTFKRFPYIVSYYEQYMEIVHFTSFDQLPFFIELIIFHERQRCLDSRIGSSYPRAARLVFLRYRKHRPRKCIGRSGSSAILHWHVRLMERISYIHRTRHARAPDNHAILIGHSYKSYSSVLDSKQQESIKIKFGDCQKLVIFSHVIKFPF